MAGTEHKSKVILFGLFYRPPNSNNEILEKIDQSIDLAMDADVSDVIITGDFNINFTDNPSRNKLLSVVNQYALFQIIDESTHFTETSSSITRNPDNVIFSGVGEAFLDQNIRYHCPVYAVFKYDKPKKQCYKRKIWKYDSGDYDSLNPMIVLIGASMILTGKA